VGFKGAILDVWRFCDRDSRGFIALEEVDHRAAKPLAVFHSFVLRTFGSSAEFFAALDTHRRGKVGRKEFVSKLVAMGMETPPPHLFELLIRAAHFSDLHSTDLTFLDKWEPPRFFIEDEDEELLRIFKQCVLELCPTLLKAWFKIVNRKMNMEWSIISWRCWLSSMSYLCKRCKRADAMLKTDLEVARVWRTMDKDCDGLVTLEDFDGHSSRVVSEMRKYVEREHGGSVNALLRAVDQAQADELGEEPGAGRADQMMQATRSCLRSFLRKQSGLSRESVDFFIESIDCEGGFVREIDLAFLDRREGHRQRLLRRASCSSSQQTAKSSC